MVSKAVLKYVRITPRKYRLIIPLVKGKRAEEAIAILTAVKKKASLYAIDLLKSAIANAKRNVQGIDTATLYISDMRADPGPTLKRFRAASMGRAGMIRKRTSHLTLILDAAKEPAPAAATGKAAGKEKVKKTQVPAAAPKKEHKEKESSPKEKKHKTQHHKK